MTAPADAPAIRPAREAEADALSALCLRAKAHWGYDANFLERCRDALRVRPDAIRDGRVFVAVDAADRSVGVCGIEIDGDVADLELLFVEPGAIGRGVGRRLFAHALALARRRGCAELTVLSDPNAAAFYERMGAAFQGMAPSDAISGRMLPLYRCRLDDSAPARSRNL